MWSSAWIAHKYLCYSNFLILFSNLIKPFLTSFTQCWEAPSFHSYLKPPFSYSSSHFPISVNISFSFFITRQFPSPLFLLSCFFFSSLFLSQSLAIVFTHCANLLAADISARTHWCASTNMHIHTQMYRHINTKLYRHTKSTECSSPRRRGLKSG